MTEVRYSPWQSSGSRTGSWSAKKSSDGYLIDDLRQRRTDSGTPEGGTSVTYHPDWHVPSLIFYDDPDSVDEEYRVRLIYLDRVHGGASAG